MFIPTDVPKVPLSAQLSSTVLAMQKGGILYSEALTEFRRQFITQLLLRTGGNLCKAARAAGVHRNTLTRNCQELKIDARRIRREVEGKGVQARIRFENRRRDQRAWEAQA